VPGIVNLQGIQEGIFMFVETLYTTHEDEKKAVVTPAVRGVITLLLISFVNGRYVFAINEYYRDS
jgi:hypothetical protein